MHPTTIAAETNSSTQGCLEFASLYQHPLLEEPLTSSACADDRRQYMMMTRKAQNLCLECPLMTQCLYDAVVNHDVAGFVAGTTPQQRKEMRAKLGITVAPEDFDTLAGVTARHRQVDHDEVVRLRHANPHESLETLAHRLGCSLSTVKRHLRKHRAEADKPAPKKPAKPALAEVLAVYRAMVAPSHQRRAA
ncbi:WhiB family transcriptional regulator [Granulicoccus phenolivorans]|uniref:WhiB family transcriptional regulator n=1 Tax=Granulicoccus phenolivorans TaxID=266854 RepID=UPI0003FAEC46|nr:WhiB family transcriptional regulator [Granulicoccus phenolivorans]